MDEEQRTEVYNRDAELAPLIGNRIRYAPTVNELVLIWQPGHEMGVTSLPLADQEGWLLYYSRSQSDGR